ncbi:MAG: transporter [Candidatus Contendobacter sp.]|nr:transporter [Candidatus Contendobacter sp.]MDG4558691.1 transporter [Candidatus Contendobacter sp.]
MNLTKKLLALITLATLTSPTALAKEGPDQYPNGAENFLAGALPPPGNYFINYLGYYDGEYRGPNGDKVPGLQVSAVFDALRYIYVSNHQILGGSFGMHAIVPFIHQSLDTPFPTIGNGDVSGLGDIIIGPLIIGWHFPPEWHVTVGLDISLPTGKYSSTDPTDSIGVNYYSFEPIFAFTYLSQGGFEVSAKLMYNIKTRNDDTDYESGDEFHMDYLIGQHFGPWAVGIGGYYLKQTTDDTLNGQQVGPDGNRGQVFAFGPAVKYDYQGISFVGAWDYETDAENRFQGNKFFLKLITAF